jgi:DNA processing protein
MQKDTKSELRLWLAFYFCQGIGSQIATRLLTRFSITELFALDYRELLCLGLNEHQALQLSKPDQQKIDAVIQYCDNNSIEIIYLTHPDYPFQLKEISSAPMVLFCRGNLALLNEPQIAIVGSRSATTGGVRLAEEFANQLGQVGIVVTSGLARGIDSAAHKGCLSAMTGTIAVLGCGVDVVYPKSNHVLYQQIIENGLVVSEFLPGTQAKAFHFPKRNRIVAGLSLGVLVVEAETKSGSLITARYALEQNREVFAIPGSLFNKHNSGCHLLIKQGAKLTENINDVLQELRVPLKNCLYKEYREEENTALTNEQARVLACLAFDVTSVDAVVARSGLLVNQVVNTLLDLELAGQVERVLDGYIRLGRR